MNGKIQDKQTIPNHHTQSFEHVCNMCTNNLEECEGCRWFEEFEPSEPLDRNELPTLREVMISEASRGVYYNDGPEDIHLMVQQDS